MVVFHVRQRLFNLCYLRFFRCDPHTLLLFQYYNQPLCWIRCLYAILHGRDLFHATLGLFFPTTLLLLLWCAALGAYEVTHFVVEFVLFVIVSLMYGVYGAIQFVVCRATQSMLYWISHCVRTERYFATLRPAHYVAYEMNNNIVALFAPFLADATALCYFYKLEYPDLYACADVPLNDYLSYSAHEVITAVLLSGYPSNALFEALQEYDNAANALYAVVDEMMTAA